MVANSRAVTVQVACAWCKKTFTSTESELRARMKRNVTGLLFCGRDCVTAYRKEHYNHPDFIARIKAAQTRTRDYVAEHGVLPPELTSLPPQVRQPWLKFKCDACEKPYELPQWRHNRRVKKNLSKLYYCGAKCAQQAGADAKKKKHAAKG